MLKNSMDGSKNHCFEWEEPYIKEYILYESTYMVGSGKGKDNLGRKIGTVNASGGLGKGERFTEKGRRDLLGGWVVFCILREV